MGTRVYIGGLPYRVKERDIERFFRGYGKLREVLIKNGYGFVVSWQLLVSQSVPGMNSERPVAGV